MMIAVGAALLFLQVSAGAEVRTFTAAITDDKDAPVGGLVREDVAVLENGVVRDVTRIEPDQRPLTVAVVVDSSQPVGSSFRLSVVDPVIAFIRRLPEGSRYSLWTTGDRPTKVVDFTTDPAAVANALRRVAPIGGNTLLDAIVEAGQELKKQEGQRSALVVITGLGVDFSNRDRYRAVDEALGKADVFMAVEFEEGDSSFEQKAAFDHVLGTLTGKTGGLLERPLSVMGVEKALQRFAADLRGRYRLSYATLPEIKERKIEVRVARPGVKVRVSPTTQAKP